MNELRVARIVDRTRAEGPGWRSAVWVQGCAIRCPGCFNAELWPARGGTIMHVRDLTDRLLGATGVEGVTLLGGEPFEQAAGLADVAEAVREAGRSVMTFTGHRLEDLDAGEEDTRRLLAATDLLVDGPYMARRPDRTRPWVGSANQSFQYLTERYLHLQDRLEAIPDRVEIRIAVDGTVEANGMASGRQFAGLRRSVESVGRTHPGGSA